MRRSTYTGKKKSVSAYDFRPSATHINRKELKLLEEFKQSEKTCAQLQITNEPSYTDLVDKWEEEEETSLQFHKNEAHCVSNMIVKKEASKSSSLSSVYDGRKSSMTTFLQRLKYKKYGKTYASTPLLKDASIKSDISIVENKIALPAPGICKRIYADERDVSIHPSFSNFEIPYDLVCLSRIRDLKRRFEKQFQYEIKQILEYTPNAYDVARLHCAFSYTTMWPPLHNKKEFEYTSRMFELSPKERRRVNYLMTNNIT